MKPRVLIAGVLLASALSLWGQEISDGTLRIQLHPDIGRFSFFAEAHGDQPVSLLFEPDPRTTTLSILEENRVHPMGEGGGFTRTVETDRDTLTILWTSPTLRVEQTVSLAGTAAGTAAMLIRIGNLSESTRAIAVRYLIDAEPADTSVPHFQTGEGLMLDSEFTMTPSPADSYWVALTGFRPFFYTVAGPRTTPAERVVFANWKRLNDARWDFPPSPGRSFSLVPFSINDSAAAVYYPTRALAPGETREIGFLLGTGDRPGSADPQTAKIERRTTPTRPVEDLANLDTVNDLLGEINRLLASQHTVTPTQVDALRARLQLVAPEPQETPGTTTETR